MPVILKPSKELVDRLGDEATSEIVGWLNSMDASSKDELRTLNEQNWARFESKLDQRTAELRAEITRVATDLNARIAELNARMDKTAAELKEVLERRLGEQTRWLYLGWAVQGAMIIGLYFK